MSEATGAEETEAFARQLRELKDRSGLSYGALAKRLHMSTSTLHRYCNGTAVPNDYAPVERLARLCRATPQELVELHRRWILADAARGRRGDQAAAPTGSTQGPGPAGATAVADAPASNEGDGDGDGGAVVVAAARPRGPSRPRPGRRSVLVASAAVAVVLGTVALAIRLPAGGDDTGGRQEAGAAASITGTADPGKPSATPTPSGKRIKPSASTAADPSKDDGKQKTAEPTAPTAVTTTVPLTVGTRPYVYDNPCSQHFLVDSEPEQVGPPANEQDAPRWAAAYGAVSSGEQRVALTVQGTGEETVVLEALHIRVLAKGAPLAWNDYSMGVGCGGGVDTKSFDVDLDNGSPTVTVKNGQRDFPYKVSESDPEVFYVTAHSKAHDVRWDLTLDWSSGSRRGTVRIDNNGTAFRTSADTARPGYDYPLGGGEWIKRES
ncbi:helix-turn-helix transcriptional regulator [Streptomyces sp. NPDC096040]|uniref:helix-turn-helix domain-containing protein n=1 Tax=Streptomyces sp. NPDC096040 TaxID=3155541 RepID=UPI00332753F2